MESHTVIACLEKIFALAGTCAFLHSDRGSSLISEETRNRLLRNGVAYSNSSRYNPRGNGQVERFNGVIWTSIKLALRERNLPDSYFESVLSIALHSQRSLLCTATNATPHEKMFSFPRRSGTGDSLPSWLLDSGLVLVRNHARRSKYSPLVSKVELVDVNPAFAKVRFPCGRESSVSLRDLAPSPRDDTELSIVNPAIPSGDFSDRQATRLPLASAYHSTYC